MSGVVVIRRCASAEEAAIVRALLQDVGMPANLENWYHAMTDWGSLQALGGVGVQVPLHKAREAQEAIIDYALSAEERLLSEFHDLEPAPLKPRRFRQIILLGWYSGLLQALYVLLVFASAMVYGVIATSAGGPFRWQLLGAQLAKFEWAYYLLTVLVSTMAFFVPLMIFVFLASRFLQRRAAMKVAS